MNSIESRLAASSAATGAQLLAAGTRSAVPATTQILPASVDPSLSPTSLSSTTSSISMMNPHSAAPTIASTSTSSMYIGATGESLSSHRTAVLPMSAINLGMGESNPWPFQGGQSTVTAGSDGAELSPTADRALPAAQGPSETVVQSIDIVEPPSSIWTSAWLSPQSLSVFESTQSANAPLATWEALGPPPDTSGFFAGPQLVVNAQELKTPAYGADASTVSPFAAFPNGFFSASAFSPPAEAHGVSGEIHLSTTSGPNQQSTFTHENNGALSQLVTGERGSANGGGGSSSTATTAKIGSPTSISGVPSNATPHVSSVGTSDQNGDFQASHHVVIVMASVFVAFIGIAALATVASWILRTRRESIPCCCCSSERDDNLEEMNFGFEQGSLCDPKFPGADERSMTEEQEHDENWLTPFDATSAERMSASSRPAVVLSPAHSTDIFRHHRDVAPGSLSGGAMPRPPVLEKGEDQAPQDFARLRSPPTNFHPSLPSTAAMQSWRTIRLSKAAAPEDVSLRDDFSATGLRSENNNVTSGSEPCSQTADRAPSTGTWASSFKSRLDSAFDTAAHSYQNLEANRMPPLSNNQNDQAPSANQSLNWVPACGQSDNWPQTSPRPHSPKPPPPVQLEPEPSGRLEDLVHMTLQRSNSETSCANSRPEYSLRSITAASSVYSDASAAAPLKSDFCSEAPVAGKSRPSNVAQPPDESILGTTSQWGPAEGSSNLDDRPEGGTDERRQLRLRRKKSNALGLQLHV